MKKFMHIIVIGVFFICGKLSAQTLDYYTGKDTISGEGFAYKVTLINGSLFLENTQNTWFQKENFYEYINKEVAPEKLFHVNGYAHILSRETIVDLFKTVIAPEEVERLKPGNHPTLKSGFTIYFCSDLNGNILEVKFLMPADDTTLLSIISPNKLYQYEQLLKENIKYKVVDSMRGVVTFVKGVRSMLFYNNL